MEWKEVRLGDVCEIKGGKRLPKGVNLITQKNSHPYIRVRDLGKSKTIELNSSYEYVDEITQKQIQRYITQKGDILISIVGTIGLIAIVGGSLDGANLTENCVKLVKLDKIDSEYLYYYLKSPFGQQNISRGTVGAVQAKLPIKNIQDFSIICPELISDQRRIVSILSSLDRKIELNNKINADLEEMAQAIFKNWFVDFEPFKDGKFVDSELGMIPEGWKVGCLGDMGAVVCGKTPSKSNSNYYGGDIPFIKIPDMHGNVFVENSEDRLTEEGSLSQIKKLIPPYSLMVSCIATVGLVSINTKPSHTNQQINTVIPHNKSALFYLYQHIKNNEEFLKNMGRGGTTTLNVNTKSFSNIRLLIPSEIALEQFHGIVEGLFKKIEQNLHESRTLSLLRDTLLPRLMSGELEVPE